MYTYAFDARLRRASIVEVGDGAGLPKGTPMWHRASAARDALRRHGGRTRTKKDRTSNRPVRPPMPDAVALGLKETPCT